MVVLPIQRPGISGSIVLDVFATFAFFVPVGFAAARVAPPAAGLGVLPCPASAYAVPPPAMTNRTAMPAYSGARDRLRWCRCGGWNWP